MGYLSNWTTAIKNLFSGSDSSLRSNPYYSIYNLIIGYIYLSDITPPLTHPLY